ncbi:unnamed protein product [Toxocara canis]|uniref:Uncharacterized protein n=1 Tax=Toxocara canis TaxID=6265 RepID=A0A183U4V0_TOXCA|nr:unnamed protein product [Toxocara canis]
MFVVETRRNSSPQIGVVTSHGNSLSSENDSLTFNTDDGANGRDSEDTSRRSPPIAEASALDRQSLLLRAVTSRRSQSTRPPHSVSTAANSNRGDHHVIITPRSQQLRNARCGEITEPQRPFRAAASAINVINERNRMASPRGGANSNSNGSKTPQSEVVEPACPPDCISPLVCKRLLSLSEDMNLLVRNITKEAKTLVHAETYVLLLFLLIYFVCFV